MARAQRIRQLSRVSSVEATWLEVHTLADLADGSPLDVADQKKRVASFDAWALTHGPALLRFARVVTGNTHDAADAVQDALVAVYPRWRRLSSDGAQDSYARRVIVNRTISWWRRFGRRERLTEVTDAFAPALPDHASLSSDAAAALALLACLPAQQRAAVTLRFYDDLAYAEIADILHCTENTARSHVHRALLRLREQLAESDLSESSKGRIE